MLIVTRDGIKTEDQLVQEDAHEGSGEATPNGAMGGVTVVCRCGALTTLPSIPTGFKVCSGQCGGVWAW